MHRIPSVIRESPAFARHADHFSRRIGSHLAAPLAKARAAILRQRYGQIIAEAWSTQQPEQRTKTIFDAQDRRRAGQLDEEGEHQFVQSVTGLIGELPDVPPLAKWAGANASDSWTAIKHLADAAAEMARIMADDELDALADQCGVRGQHDEARRARLRDTIWVRKTVRRQIRTYRECGWYRLAPLQIKRASIDSQMDDHSQNTATDRFIKQFGQLQNTETGEIIQLPDRATQLSRKNAEMICRKKGIANKARAMDLAGYIVTMTCPTQYHPTTSAGVKRERRENPKYNRALTVLDAHQFLVQQFAALGRWAAKREIPILGMRAAHPHEDGCPHWHLVLLVHPSQAWRVKRWLLRRFKERGVTQMDFQKLKPYREGADSIDAAMSYAAAYLSAAHVAGDEIDIVTGDDGLELTGQTTPDLYRAWRRAYGLREFSFFEFGIGDRQRGLVTAWRLLRKRNPPVELAGAVQSGDWFKFEKLCRQFEVKLIYEEHVNGFGEIKNKLAGVRLNDGSFITAASAWKPLWRRFEGGRELVSKHQEPPQPPTPIAEKISSSPPAPPD